VPVKFGKNPGNYRGNAKYRETDQAKCEHQNADQVVTEVAPGSLEGRGKKQRWEKNKKYNLGIQLRMRHARQQAE